MGQRPVSDDQLSVHSRRVCSLLLELSIGLLLGLSFSALPAPRAVARSQQLDLLGQGGDLLLRLTTSGGTAGLWFGGVPGGPAQTVVHAADATASLELGAGTNAGLLRLASAPLAHAEDALWLQVGWPKDSVALVRTADADAYAQFECPHRALFRLRPRDWGGGWQPMPSFFRERPGQSASEEVP